MEPLAVVADRFVIERRAGSGGMSDVYLARDRASGSNVALKVLRVRHELAETRGLSATEAARFEREAAVLATLDHPAIVRYVAHGTTSTGAAYLATEWIEGTTLSAVLARGPLAPGDAIALGLRVSDALAAAHARGVVHRDVKPSNVLCPSDDLACARLIDFGIARPDGGRTSLTITGAVVGTPGYMAPEQARGDAVIDARADVFSLGAVLFRCLAGRPPFEGGDVLAILVKVVLEEPPRVIDLAPSTPPELDALVGEMLAKDPRDRPRDAAEVGARLAAIARGSTPSFVHGGEPRGAAIGTEERRVVTVVLARARREQVAPRADDDAAETLTRVEDARDAHAMAARHGGELHALADGSLLVGFRGRAPPTDLAAGAARCALALHAALADARVAVVSGAVVVGPALPLGAVIDRGVALLAADPSRGPRVDDDTAALLDARFAIERDAAGRVITRETELATGARTLLGRETPLVGRRREMALLEAAIGACAADGAAQAAVLIGASGVGKSRLRYELEKRVASIEPRPTWWVARGDPLRSDAAFGLLAQLVRRAAHLLEGEPGEERRGKIAARVAEHADARDAARIAEFLGEVVGAAFPAEARIELAAARRDPALMRDQVRRAWLDFVRAECDAAPVVLVLEDLHAGDPATVELVDATLRGLADRPLFVLALARPEIAQRFPALWESRPVMRVVVQELPKKACRELARDVLGAAPSSDDIEAIVDKSAGNAFYLEELLRAASERRGGDVPPSVLAMVQARLERLDVEQRRVLRAASVFGDAFWMGGIGALLGRATTPTRLDEAVGALVRDEWIAPRAEARFRGERELVMRHALVRDAVYEMLTEDDRRLGHRLAGAWLVEVGETDAALVAAHLERGGELDEAARWLDRAASQALDAGDFSAAIAHVERALGSGAALERRGEMLAIAAEAHRWRGEHARAVACAEAALEELAPGSRAWLAVAGELAVAASYLGAADKTLAAARALLDAWPSPPTAAAMVAAARATAPAIFAGHAEIAHRLGARLDEAAPSFGSDPLVIAWVARARAVLARFDGDPDRYRSQMERAARYAERAGDARAACNYGMTVGFACLELGAFDEAVASLERALADAERLGIETVAATTRANLGLALARTGELERAREVEGAAIAAFERHGDKRSAGCARVYLALILEASGDLVAAEVEARRAIEFLVVAPPMLPLALATLAEILLACGRLDEARERARAAAEAVYTVAKVDEGEALARVVHAEVLAASGDLRGAREVVALARERIEARARSIADPSRRRAFLERVPEHARTFALSARLVREGI